MEVENSTISNLEITSPVAIYEFLNKDEIELQTSYIGITKVNPDIQKGEKIGQFIISNHGEVVKTMDVFMPVTLQKSIWSNIIKYGGIIILLILTFTMFILGRKKYVQSRNH